MGKNGMMLAGFLNLSGVTRSGDSPSCISMRRLRYDNHLDDLYDQASFRTNHMYDQVSLLTGWINFLTVTMGRLPMLR